MIKKSAEKEEVFYRMLREVQRVRNFDIEKEREMLEDTFRAANLTIDHIENLKLENENFLKSIKYKMDDLMFMNDQMRKCEFRSKNELSKTSFGCLILNKYLASSSLDKTIKIWDLEANKCVRTLTEGESIRNLEALPNNRLISVSDYYSLKIWNISNGGCVKTLNKIFIVCLKVLTDNRVVIATSDEIKIWDIDNDTCIKTMNDHSSLIKSLLILPNNMMASGSNDKTIKLWNMNEYNCIRTLIGHTDEVYCLFLLKNGQLASGSKDETIKIWDTDTGECVKTLKGHTNSVNGLESTDNFELISCSSDNTIKIWNLTTGKCTKNIVDKSRIVCLKHYFDDFIISGSASGSIKIWNLSTEECVQKMEGQEKFIYSLIFI